METPAQICLGGKSVSLISCNSIELWSFISPYMLVVWRLQVWRGNIWTLDYNVVDHNIITLTATWANKTFTPYSAGKRHLIASQRDLIKYIDLYCWFTLICTSIIFSPNTMDLWSHEKLYNWTYQESIENVSLITRSIHMTATY
jgi:hypothetical protein